MITLGYCWLTAQGVAPWNTDMFLMSAVMDAITLSEVFPLVEYHKS